MTSDVEIPTGETIRWRLNGIHSSQSEARTTVTSAPVHAKRHRKPCVTRHFFMTQIQPRVLMLVYDGATS